MAQATQYRMRLGQWAAVGLVVLTCGRGYAAGPPTSAAADDEPVRVRYHALPARTDLMPLVDGTAYFTDEASPLGKLPPGMDGLMFTRRPAWRPSDVTVTVPAGATVAVLVPSERTAARNVVRKVRSLHDQLIRLGFTRLADVAHTAGSETDRERVPAVFLETFATAAEFTLGNSVGTGTVIAARSLALDNSTVPRPPTVASAPVPSTPVVATPVTAARPTAPSRVPSMHAASPVTRVASQQASIKALEVIETDSGLRLGRASEVVLTAMRGHDGTRRQLDVEFVGKVGEDMRMAKDDALRFLRLSYPEWDVDRAEITFEDKYDHHDGGSIGAAVGTLVISVVQGVALDPKLAMTGDVSANGKVRAIGAVAAKLTGAAAAGCTTVALPADNYDQLVDAVVFAGPAAACSVQVLGMADLTDAIAVARADRDVKMAGAMAAFADVQREVLASPAYLKRKEAADQLAAVVAAAPNHLSARVLLAVARGTAPKTLSITASQYYLALAVREMLTGLDRRSEHGGRAAVDVPPASLRSGLADLRKLRPLADPRTRPLIDAWSRFVGAVNAYQQHGATANDVDRERQRLSDEMQRQQSDPVVMQQLLNEGI